MPASRSRTERWRELLQQIAQRGGGIEFAISRPEYDTKGTDLLWRVRLYAVGDAQLVVEHPAAAGSPIRIPVGQELVAVMAIGQNRWMFRSRVLAVTPPSSRGPPARTLAAPESIERCSRREFLRVSTAQVNLPAVRCYPLLDPTSVVSAEVANRALIQSIERGDRAPFALDEELAMPEVGPAFPARLMNLSGGGIGLVIVKDDHAAATHSRLLWCQLDLRPHIAAPLGITIRVAHTHIDSEQNLYLGGAFDFAFHAAHREFVVEQAARYVGRLIARGAAMAA
jgi:hypothetical protein